jgi:hypothetical protein
VALSPRPNYTEWATAKGNFIFLPKSQPHFLSFNFLKGSVLLRTLFFRDLIQYCTCTFIWTDWRVSFHSSRNLFQHEVSIEELSKCITTQFLAVLGWCLHPCSEGVVAKGGIKIYYIPGFSLRVINGRRAVMVPNKGQDVRHIIRFMGAVRCN